jgi:hypothetical protein
MVLDAASGLSPGALARKYGLTVRKVTALLRNPEMQAQVQECSRRLAKIGDYARNRLIAAAPELVDAQLEVALGRRVVLDDLDNPIPGPDGEPLTDWKYDVRERMAAGRYCLDKIIPTITRQEHEVNQIPSEAVLAIRDHLSVLTARPASQDLLSTSPHIFEGKAALPQAIDVESLSAPTPEATT